MGRYDDDEDEMPVRRATAKKYSEDNSDEQEDVGTLKTKSKVVDDDDDDTPPSPRTIKRGWGAVESVVSSDSSFAQRLKVGDDPVIVKFLEDEPYAVLRQHWIERPGQKSFTCIADLSSKGCPLCDAGNRPSSRFNFNVALLVDHEEPLIKSYEVGARVIDQLKNFSVDPRQGPLTKHYWAISRSGKGARSSTNHQMLRDRDLEDYSVEPLDEDDLKRLRKKAYDASIIQIPEYKTLLDIAKEELDD
jgi:hypothetical protein